MSKRARDELQTICDICLRSTTESKEVVICSKCDFPFHVKCLQDKKEVRKSRNIVFSFSNKPTIE